MVFSKAKYKKSLKNKFLKNPGKKNRELRKEVLNANRGERVPSTRVVEEKKQKELNKRTDREMREES